MTSQFIGKLGKRIATNITVRSVIKRQGWKSYLHMTEDCNHNLITFSSAVKFDVGSKWKLDGVVKRHCEFNSQCQTHINRWGLELIKG